MQKNTSITNLLGLKLDEFTNLFMQDRNQKTFSFKIPKLNSGNCISVGRGLLDILFPEAIVPIHFLSCIFKAI